MNKWKEQIIIWRYQCWSLFIITLRDFFDGRNNSSPSCYLKTPSTGKCISAGCSTWSQERCSLSESSCRVRYGTEWSEGATDQPTHISLPWMGSTGVLSIRVLSLSVVTGHPRARSGCKTIPGRTSLESVIFSLSDFPPYTTSSPFLPSTM